MDDYKVITGLRQVPYASEGGIFYDETKLENILQQVQQGLTTQAVSATEQWDPQQGKFVYTAEQLGSSLDIEPIREQVLDSIMSLNSVDIALTPQTITPEITAESLQGQNALIVNAETIINKSSEEGRTENIRVALAYLNNAKVMPGETFSFNKAVGKRTEKNGYREALEIEYGQYTYGIGGGVCQVSTTLYQAVLRAGLKVEKRLPHAIPSNYCEMGQDATVTDNGKDFVFRNTSDAPIYITGSIQESGKNQRCTIQIYGKPLEGGIRYVLESQQVGLEIPPEPPIKYVKDKKQEYVMYEDEEKEVTKARMGYNVVTYLVKQRAGDNLEIDRVQIGEDKYPPASAVVYVGTTPRFIE
jgi:vancomycin resistance protein YoaR